MAHLYVGDPSRVDADVLRSLAALPDDFWALGEFTLRRNHDWFILHPYAASPAALIATEVKRLTRPLRGSMNAAWEEQAESGDWLPILASNPEDRNYYWQAVNAANALSEWLRNNEPVFNEGEGGVWTESRVWPDLLVLSPPGTTHYLPYKPDSGFGAWYFALDRWVDHLRSWRPRMGPVLTQQHIERLVSYLRLTEVNVEVEPGDDPEGASDGDPVQAPPAPAAPVVIQPPVADITVDGSPDLQQHVAALAQTVDALTRRVGALEQALAMAARALGSASESRAVAPVVREARPLTAEERAAIVRATQSAIAKGYVRSFPSVLKELETVLGEDLKASSYRGFGTASALFQQAAREGVVQLGTKRGPSPTLWLPNETPE